MTAKGGPGRPQRRTAVVFSSGAMFGAYHAGAWKALSRQFRPDVIVGASVGSLNGWAIAGGVDPDFLIQRWMQAEAAGEMRIRFPRHWLDGWVDAPHLEQWIREMHQQFTPKVDYALVLTRLWPLRPELVLGDAVTWQHIASSCAVPFVFPHYRLDGTVYTDGGLLQAMPLWPARELRCQKVLAINCLPALPFAGGKAASRLMRFISRHDFALPSAINLLTISPERHLGTTRDFIRWERGNMERWIELGYRDASIALEQNPEFFDDSLSGQAGEL